VYCLEIIVFVIQCVNTNRVVFVTTCLVLVSHVYIDHGWVLFFDWFWFILWNSRDRVKLKIEQMVHDTHCSVALLFWCLNLVYLF